MKLFQQNEIPDEKRIKELKDIVKNYAIEMFGENDTKVELISDNFVWDAIVTGKQIGRAHV